MNDIQTVLAAIEVLEGRKRVDELTNIPLHEVVDVLFIVLCSFAISTFIADHSRRMTRDEETAMFDILEARLAHIFTLLTRRGGAKP